MRTLLAFLLTCNGQYAPARKGRGVAFDLPSCRAELTSNLEPPLFGVWAPKATPVGADFHNRKIAIDSFSE
jgi:hypothetical protein